MNRTAIMLLAAGLLASPLAFASHSWGNYHWARTANPFTLTVAANLSAAWSGYLDTVITDWSAASGWYAGTGYLGYNVLNLQRATGSANPKTCKPSGGRVEVCNAKYGNNGWLGIAQVWISSGHITQGIVKLNDSYFLSSKYNTPAWRNLVSCQEVGHTLGLGHQDEDFNNGPLFSCMDYSSNPEPNQYPNYHDYEQLELIYRHQDGFTTLGSSTTGSAAMPDNLAEPRQWGSLKHSTRGGMLESYERNVGRNLRVVTHVIWAEGRGQRPTQ